MVHKKVTLECSVGAMSLSRTDSSSCMDESSSTGSYYGPREPGSFIEPRDPSITQPWMRPRPPHGTNLCRLFEEEPEEHEESVVTQHLRVFLRIKPVLPGGKVLYHQKSTTTLLALAPVPCRDRRNPRPVNKVYRFTHIFGPENSQTQIFDEIVKDNLGKFVEGENFTLLTYGASGSGKTYSLMGTDTEPGIIPRCLEFLFARMQVAGRPTCKPGDGTGLEYLSQQQQDREVQMTEFILRSEGAAAVPNLPSYRRMSQHLSRQSQAWKASHLVQTHYEVWVSFAEIYNESIHDLLADVAVPAEPVSSLRLVQPADGQPYLKDIRWVCVRSGAEAFAVLARGRRRLRFAHTNQNSHSSRSHCLFSLKLLQHPPRDSTQVTTSTFCLCDLAGSERAKRTGNEGVRLNESRKINTSLHILERCLQATRKRQGGAQVLPPYRESKLTKLLQNALSGKEKISMLVNINPKPDCFHETQHVLQFSALAGSIEVAVGPQVKEDYSQSHAAETDHAVKLLELREELARCQLDAECQLEQYERKAEQRLEQQLEQREREVRREVAARFQDIMEQSDANAQGHFQREMELVVEKYEYEKEVLKNYYKEHLQECAGTTAALSASKLVYAQQLEDAQCRLQEVQLQLEEKERVAEAALRALEDQCCALQLRNEKMAKVLQQAGLCPAEASTEILEPDSEGVDTEETVGTSCQEQVYLLELNDNPIESDVVDDNPESCQLVMSEEATCTPVLKAAKDLPGELEFRTAEKSKLADKENCPPACLSSRRKLFSRTALDEQAASSSRRLSFDKSLGEIAPPTLQNPYGNQRPPRRKRR